MHRSIIANHYTNDKLNLVSVILIKRHELIFNIMGWITMDYFDNLNNELLNKYKKC
jgi:hypothetical protein